MWYLLINTTIGCGLIGMDAAITLDNWLEGIYAVGREGLVTRNKREVVVFELNAYGNGQMKNKVKKAVDIVAKSEKIATCSKVSKSVNSGNNISMSKVNQSECVDSSDANRARLEAWSDRTEYKNISFWIPPSVIATPDQCIAEVGKTLVQFDKLKEAGEIKPVEETTDNNL